jgi:hypothetical protein
MDQIKTKSATDFLTLVALSMLAYTVGVMLHEHLGHALTCVLLGGHPAEMGAFYVDCNYAAMPPFSIRLVALAGPLVSLITGVASLFLLGRVNKTNFHLRYWLWLLGTIGLMTATGYLLYSGISGIGDFGTGIDGVFFGAHPEWVYRLGLTVAGIASYIDVIAISLRRMDSLIGGEGIERVARAQRLSLTSYLAGAVLSILVGLFNPHGPLIVLISSVASSLGGTSGLAWMMQMLNRKKVSSEAPFQMSRSWSWIIASLAIVLAYALIFGPTLRP